MYRNFIYWFYIDWITNSCVELKQEDSVLWSSKMLITWMLANINDFKKVSIFCIMVHCILVMHFAIVITNWILGFHFLFSFYWLHCILFCILGAFSKIPLVVTQPKCVNHFILLALKTHPKLTCGCDANSSFFLSKSWGEVAWLVMMAFWFDNVGWFHFMCHIYFIFFVLSFNGCDMLVLC
jgi:hypothetical protein